MSIYVDSEIGKLRRVLVHRPDREIDWMVPRMMEQLLFDDILYAKEARAEHEDFCGVLQKAGVETLDAQDLLIEALKTQAARDQLFEDLGRHGELPRQGRESLEGLEPEELAAILVSGLRRADGYHNVDSLLFDLAPIPNYFFQRDPQSVLGDRVMISSMATGARRREALLAKAIFSHHPELSDHAGLLPIGNEMAAGFLSGGEPPTIEGGDVVIASREILLVGISQRTNRRGAERLAEHLRLNETSFRHLIMVDLPARRSYMHLDTVFTLIDEGTCLAYPPVIEPGHQLTGRAFYVDLASREFSLMLRPSLLEALDQLGMPLEVVPCGGAGDVLFQEREQWTDGANAFAIEPGVIVLYRRNRRTVDELSNRGWRVISEVDVVAGRELVVGHGRTVVTVEGDELSRARGGPRCMTMPLEREPRPSR
jgi:arginine deiminase